MYFLTWGRSPWGQTILTHISWNLLWAALFAGIAFLVAHASYMVLSAHRKRAESETDAMEAARGDLPTLITRHGSVARMFHWVMAVSTFTLAKSVTNVPLVAVSGFTGTDALSSVAGYCATTGPTQPLAGFTPSAPTGVALSEGANTIYPWLKDAAGNISLLAPSGLQRSVFLDTQPPTVDTFTLNAPAVTSGSAT